MRRFLVDRFEVFKLLRFVGCRKLVAGYCFANCQLLTANYS